MAGWRLFLAAVAATVLATAAAGPPTVNVSTADGVLRGVVVADGKQHAYRGVPFAKPPVGGRRWAMPLRNEPWTGARDATAYEKPCLTKGTPDAIANMSEDCLYLNVRLSIVHLFRIRKRSHLLSLA